MSRIACPSCREQYDIDPGTPDNYNVSCPGCGAAFRVGDSRVVNVRLKRLKKRHSAADTFAAFLLCLIVPGLGHLVKKKPADTFIWIAIAAAVFVLAVVTTQQLGPAVFAYVVVAFLSAVGSLAA